MLPINSGVALPQVTGAAPQSVENLFEHMASRLQGQTSGMDPANLGSAMLQGMDGFLRHSSSMASYMGQMTKRFPSQQRDSSLQFVSAKGNASGTSAAKSGGSQNAAVSTDDQSRLAEWLMKSFNFSIESGVVAGSTSKMTNSINTLLRGQ